MQKEEIEVEIQRRVDALLEERTLSALPPNPRLREQVLRSALSREMQRSDALDTRVTQLVAKCLGLQEGLNERDLGIQ